MEGEKLLQRVGVALDTGKAPFVFEMPWAGKYINFQVGIRVRSAMRLPVSLKGSGQICHMTQGKSQ